MDWALQGKSRWTKESKQTRSTDKPSDENWDGFLNNMAYVVRHPLKKAGVTKFNKKDKEVDKLCEEGDEELQVQEHQGCGERSQNT